MLEIKINTKNKAEAQKIVADLGLLYNIKQAKYNKDIWIFDNPKKAKYFLKENYFDFENNKNIKFKKLKK